LLLVLLLLLGALLLLVLLLLLGALLLLVLLLLLGPLLLLLVVLLLLVLRVTFFASLLFGFGLPLRLAMFFVWLILLCPGRSGTEKRRQNCYADNSDSFHRSFTSMSAYMQQR
jgi:hypothetical protein